RTAPRPPHAHAPRVHLVAPAPDDVAVEAHEEPDLVGRALPVLRGERVRRDVLDADLDRARDDVEQRRLARLVARRARQPARVGPAPVAVHDDRDVVRHELRRDRRRSRTARVRERRLVRAPRHQASAPLPGSGRSAPAPAGPASGAAGASRSTMRSDRNVLSRWYWLYAATRPLASLRCRASDASAVSHSPASRAAGGAKVWGAGARSEGRRV